MVGSRLVSRTCSIQNAHEQFSVNDEVQSCYVATRTIVKLVIKEMKISGFTFLRNADINGYPFIEVSGQCYSYSSVTNAGVTEFR